MWLSQNDRIEDATPIHVAAIVPDLRRGMYEYPNKPGFFQALSVDLQ